MSLHTPGISRFSRFAATLLAVLAIADARIAAQVTTGTLVGTVRDTNGIVPGATVTIVDTATRLTRNAVTGETGTVTLSSGTNVGSVVSVGGLAIGMAACIMIFFAALLVEVFARDLVGNSASAAGEVRVKGAPKRRSGR